MSKKPVAQTPHNEADLNRTRIIEAMRRILTGKPLHVTAGRYSVLALAEESNVERNRFNREYVDLRDEFKTLVDAGIAPREPSSELEVALADELAKATADLQATAQRYTESQEERAQWKEAAETFIRVIQTKDIEIATLQTNARTANLRIKRLEAELREAKTAAQASGDLSLGSGSGSVVQLVQTSPGDDSREE